MPIYNVQQNNFNSLQKIPSDEDHNNCNQMENDERIIYTKERHGEIEDFERVFIEKYIIQVENDFKEIILNFGLDACLIRQVKIFTEKLLTPYDIDVLNKGDLYHGLSLWLMQLKTLKAPVCTMIKYEIENMLQDLEYCIYGSLIRIKEACHNIYLIINSSLPEKLESEKIKIANEIIAWFTKWHHENISEDMEIHYINGYKLLLKNQGWNLECLEHDPYYTRSVEKEIKEIFPWLLEELNEKCHISLLIKHYGDCLYEQIYTLTQEKDYHYIEAAQCYLTEEGFNVISQCQQVISYNVKKGEILKESDTIGRFYLRPNNGVYYCALAMALAEARVGYDVKNVICTPEADLMSAAGTYWFVDKKLKLRSLVTLESLQKHKIGGILSDECLLYAINNTPEDRIVDYFDPSWISMPRRLFRKVTNVRVYKALAHCFHRKIIGKEYHDSSKNNILMFAVSFNDSDFIRHLIINEAININHANEKGETALWCAMENDACLDTVKMLVENKADLDCENHLGHGLLTPAVKKRNIEVARFLINHGAKVNHTAKDGNTALTLAIKLKDINMVELLMSHGANAHHIMDDGSTTLIIAVENHDINMAEILLAQGVDVNQTVWHEHTALSVAADDGDINMVRTLLNYGANTEHVNYDGVTILITAAAENKMDLAKLLLDHGANVNTVLIEEYVAINAAVLNGNIEMVKLLLCYGANVDILMADGHTPLVSAVYEKNIEMAGLLLNHGANVNHVTEEGDTILYTAVINHNSDMIKLLVDNKVNINMRNLKMGSETPLMTAIRLDNISIATLLINYGASLDDTDEYGCTALFYAVRGKNIDLVKLILKKQYYINHENNNGENVLMLAARGKQREIASLLLEKITSTKRTNQLPLKTAFFLAVQSREVNQVKCFIARNKNLFNLATETGNTAKYIAGLTEDKMMIEFLREIHTQAGFGTIPITILSNDYGEVRRSPMSLSVLMAMYDDVIISTGQG